ncbi:MAG: NAD(P)/FAD-dependent oxidoreductase [Candidatus Leucobacter sulfamidivorax]|nr:NAD(P)/FAD-dependent oxidoreductase [Candidatus Leucobacter sulfamidivorax]
MTPQNELPTTYLVVGAGPFGLLTARGLLHQGIDVEIVERHDDVGGIWDIGNPGSPMYDTCHFITSKTLGGYVDFPMPDDYPTYPSQRQVLDYVRAFARAYGLYERTRFGTEVVRAEPVGEGDDAYWRVETSDGEERLYRGVFAACGQQWWPYVPELPGADEFLGEIYHSSQYHSPQQFAGKRVLVVGAGNSGVDIAVDAAEHGEASFISTRRDYYWFPKQVYGVPTPDLMTGKAPFPQMPLLGRTPDPMETVALVLAAIGPMSAYGLPEPSDPVGSTHPIVSDLALHCFTHGTLQHRPGIARITADAVEFVDGRSERVDVIVLATGYDMRYPWLPDGAVDYEEGHPVFHLGTFGRVRGLYGVGTIHPSRADAWQIFDQLTHLAIADAKATLTGENAENLRVLREEYEIDLKGGFPYLDVRRNVNQAADAPLRQLFDDLQHRFGIEMPTELKGGFFPAGTEAAMTATAAVTA